ncbi:MAG: polyketide synthase [Candidatus Eisenbacteria bacterium]
MQSGDPHGLEIAIVGWAGRMPGAPSIDAFWQNLRAGVESIRDLSDDELRAAGVDDANQAHYVRRAADLNDVDLFDAPLFGLTRREAELTDPQFRVFLEDAWTALEDAGHLGDARDLRVGVFAGASSSSYLGAGGQGGFLSALGNARDYLATQVSYRLNLTGPSLTVQTACSTSLVAVHLACQSLLNHECDLALAGGVSIGLPQTAGYLYEEGDIASPDGRCRAFDAAAAGCIKGNGSGLVVLRRLEDALRDGDDIRAVIKGTAINNDGSDKVGFTAPSVSGQASVIREALAVAEVEPSSIDYVEAHGTATPLGDPIEVAALRQAFGSREAGAPRCALGSVKTNIGHLDAAAGVAGLLKAALALQHGELPPSLHFERPNPKLELDSSSFFVNATLRQWPAREGSARRAGVSSFGIGGTNAHAVLEEAPRTNRARRGERMRGPSCSCSPRRVTKRFASTRRRWPRGSTRKISTSPTWPLPSRSDGSASRTVAPWWHRPQPRRRARSVRRAA